MTRLAQLRRSVNSRLGTPVTDQFQTSDVIDEYINVAIQTIEQEARWPWQEAVQSVTINDTTGEFAVLADWKATRSVIADQRQVIMVSPIDVLMSPLNDAGTPQIGAVIDRVMKLRPMPTVGMVLQHIYYRTPILLFDDEDEAQMPNEYTPAIIAKACELLSVREDDRAAASAHAGEYNEWVARMRRDMRRTTGPVLPRQRPGGWV